MSILFKSLRSRLLALVLFSVLPALALMIYTGIEQRQVAANDAKLNALRLARLVSAKQQSLVEGANQMLIALAEAGYVQDEDPALCNQLLNNLVRQYSYYSSLAVVDLEGNVLCYSGSEPIQANIADRMYFQKVLQTSGFVAGEYVYGRISQRFVQPLAYPWKNRSGKVQGVLVADLDLEWLEQVAQEMALPEDGSLFILDQDGTILARYPNPEDWVGKKVMDAPIVQEILNSQGERTTETLGIDGQERLFAFVPLNSDFEDTATVSIGIPTTIAYAEVSKSLIRNLFLLSLVSVMAIIAALLISDWFIIRHLHRFITATNSIRHGEFNARLGRRSGFQEIEEMSEAFDGMAEDLQQREADLHQAEERYRSLVEQVPAVIYTADMHDRTKTLYISPVVKKMLGFSTAEWLSSNHMWLQQLHPADKERVLKAFKNAGEGGEDLALEYRLLTQQGRPIWVRDEAHIIRDHAGRATIMQGILMDISERVRAETSLKAYTVQLERSNRELEDFAYIASHDLQEPLRKIQAFGERLERKYKDVLGEDGQMYVDRMVSSAGRMQRLINDLLNYSRVSTRTRPFETIPLNDVIQEALIPLEQRILETQGRVEVEDLPSIEADKNQIRQLFQNLIGNALKFHRPEEQPVVYISGKTIPTPKGDCIVIEVEDNGIGFNNKYVERIFSPFQRLHGRLEYEGSGIGLAICRKIVERHEGSITARSTPGEGSTFIITLPYRQEEKEKE